jgi:hypothetical protein
VPEVVRAERLAGELLQRAQRERPEEQHLAVHVEGEPRQEVHLAPRPFHSPPC